MLLDKCIVNQLKATHTHFCDWTYLRQRFELPFHPCLQSKIKYHAWGERGAMCRPVSTVIVWNYLFIRINYLNV